MASRCGGFMCRTSISSIKNSFKSVTFAPPLTRSASRVSFSRMPKEVVTMMPMHSAVAKARMTSRLSTTSRNSRALTQGTLCRTSPDL